jgi:hypothetical protein
VRSDRACLLDILDAIAGIERYRSTRVAFDADERTQVWMISRLQVSCAVTIALAESLFARYAVIVP